MMQWNGHWPWTNQLQQYLTDGCTWSVQEGPSCFQTLYRVLYGILLDGELHLNVVYGT